MGKFKYQERTREDVTARKNQSGGSRESVVRDDTKLFVPKGGDYGVRILPATWEDAKHFGFDVFIHYGIGADNNAYICLQKMAHERCPICEEREKAEKAGEEEFAKQLKATKRVAMYVIDRDEEDEGVKLWLAPWTVDREISSLQEDKRTKEVFRIDHPDEGFDVSFTREGKGQQSKYLGFQLSRRDSPISKDEDAQDEILQYIADNPIPDLLLLKDAEELEQALSMTGTKGKDKDEDEDKPRRRKEKEEEDDKPARPRLGRKPREEDEDEDKDKPRGKASRDEDEDKPRRRREEEEDEDKPRRSRDEDEDKPRRSREEEDEDKPRRSKEKDEDEDKPRSRRDREEEEDPPPRKAAGSSLKDRLAAAKGKK